MIKSPWVWIHSKLTTGVHGVGARYVAETSVENLDLAAHQSRHDIGGADAIDWKDSAKLFELFTDARFLRIDLQTYDMWETDVHDSGVVYQALMGASVHTGVNAGSYARQNLNAPETILRSPCKHAYYINTTSMSGNTLAFIGCVKGVKLDETQVDTTLAINHCGIWYKDGTWYASAHNGTNAQEIETAAISGTGWLVIEFLATTIKFYWKGVLVRTLTLTMPGSGSYGYFQYLVNNLGVAANNWVAFYNLVYVGD